MMAHHKREPTPEEIVFAQLKFGPRIVSEMTICLEIDYTGIPRRYIEDNKSSEFIYRIDEFTDTCFLNRVVALGGMKLRQGTVEETFNEFMRIVAKEYVNDALLSR